MNCLNQPNLYYSLFFSICLFAFVDVPYTKVNTSMINIQRLPVNTLSNILHYYHQFGNFFTLFLKLPRKKGHLNSPSLCCNYNVLLYPYVYFLEYFHTGYIRIITMNTGLWWRQINQILVSSTELSQRVSNFITNASKNAPSVVVFTNHLFMNKLR
jgi:hypothetical protein